MHCLTLLTGWGGGLKPSALGPLGLHGGHLGCRAGHLSTGPCTTEHTKVGHAPGQSPQKDKGRRR